MSTDIGNMGTILTYILCVAWNDKNGNWILIETLYCRGWREEGDQEFVALSAMLLCGELELRQDTFQAITTKPEVSAWQGRMWGC